MQKLSFTIPIYNEEDNIEILCSKISDTMGALPFTYEIILINDGSIDGSWEKIIEIGNANSNVVGLDLAMNYGQSAALSAGIDQADGDLIITMDGDLQNDPADIPSMIEILTEKNCDVVAGERLNRKDAPISKVFTSRIANFLIRWITGVRLRDYGCALRVFRKEIAKNLDLYGELHRFIPVLVMMQGANSEQIPVQHHPRIHGKSKYGLGRIFRVLSDLMLIVFFKRYKDRPIHLFGTLGLVTFGAGVILDIYYLILKLTGHDIWGKPLLLLAFMLTLGGIQIITIGIISEMIMRTYFESQNKKTYKIKKITGSVH